MIPPQSSATLWGRGNRGRADLAVPILREALRIHPGNARLWQVLGLIYRALEDSPSAIQAFREAARLAPADPNIAHGHARVCMEGGRPAVALFDRARQLAPDNGDIIIGRAAAQAAEGGAVGAIAELDALLQKNPEWAAGHALLANLRWTLGHSQEFGASYERALRQHPGSQALWMAFIEQLIQVGMYARAEEAVARARSAAGGSLALDIADACCATEAGDLDRAGSLFARAKVLEDARVAPWYIRHLLRANRPEEAARFGERLVEDSEGGQIWPYLALAWRIIGDVRWEWLEGDPRLIGTYELEGGAQLSSLGDRLRSLHNTLSYPIGQSVRGGTRTDGPLFARADPEIRALRASIVDAVERHIRSLGAIDRRHPVLRHRPHPVRFAGSWSVRLRSAGHHTNHIHPQGWLSSAFYVSVASQELMGPAPAGWLALGEPPAELGLDLSPLRMIEPKPGRLVLFPSIMWHGTVPFAGGERLTVAFDVAPPA